MSILTVLNEEDVVGGGPTQRALGIYPDQTTTVLGQDLDHLQSIGVQTVWLVLAVEAAFPTSTTIDATFATKYDAIVNGAFDRGMNVAVQAHGMPSWITADSGHSGATDFNRLAGIFIDTNEHLQLTDGTVPADKYKHIVVHWYIGPTALAAIKAAHPRAKVYAYQNIAATIAGPHVSVGGIERPTTLVSQEEAWAHVNANPLALGNSFEEPSAGTTVAAGQGPAGNEWDLNFIDGVGSTLTVDTARFKTGAKSAKAVVTAGSTSALARWTTKIGSRSTLYHRVWINQDALPSGGGQVLLNNTGASGNPPVMSPAITPAGQLVIRNGTDTATLKTFTNAVPVDAWFRLEWKVTTAGAYEVRLFLDPDGLTPTEVQSGTDGLTVTTINSATFCIDRASSGITGWTAWFDSPAVNSTTWIGTTPGVGDAYGTDNWFVHTESPAAASITSSTNATPPVFTTGAAHGLSLTEAASGTRDWVEIRGHSIASYNGFWEVNTVPSSTTVTFRNAAGTPMAANGAGSGGTIRKIVRFCAFTFLHAANINSPSYQAQITNHLAQINSDGFDGVFLDDANMKPGHCFNEGDANDSIEFASNNDYRDIMRAMIAKFAPSARSQTLTVLPNIVGSNPWVADEYAGVTGLFTDKSVDGVYYEFYGNWPSAASPQVGEEWYYITKIQQDAEAAGIFFTGGRRELSPADNTRGIRYVTASFWLHWDGTTDSGVGYNGGRPLSAYSTYRKLIGMPTEAKQLVSGTASAAAPYGAWMRHYTGGVVVANAKSTAGLVTFNLGGTYVDPSGANVTSVQLDQGHGMVLLTQTAPAANIWHGPDTESERTNWIACVHNFLNRYSTGRIGWVECWNEPNLTEFWVQGWNNNHYARLLRAFYLDIKGTWPTIDVVGHNMSRNHDGWLFQHYAWWDIIWGTSDGAANKYGFDVLGVHPYCGNTTSGYSPEDTSHGTTTDFLGGLIYEDYTGYRQLRTRIFNKEGFNKPLAFGEFGYAVMGSGWFLVSETQRANYVTSAFTLADTDGYVEYLNIYYHWRHETPSNYDTSFNIHNTSTETAFADSSGGGGPGEDPPPPATSGTTIEVAFATDPLSTTPSWIDITEYAILQEGELQITRGSADEFSAVQPSTLNLWLDNSDGRFTRGLSTSPYYPNVKNGKRIRVSITFGGTTYRRFDGHVNNWPTAWRVTGSNPYIPVQITAVDRFDRLNKRGELRSVIEEEYLRDVTMQGTRGAAYYPLSEPSGAASAGNVTPHPQGNAVVTTFAGDGEIEFGSGIGPGTDELSAAQFQPTSPTAGGKYLQAELFTPVGGSSGLTLEAYMLAPSATNTRDIVCLEAAQGRRAELSFNNLGKLVGFTTGTNGVANYTLTSANSVNNGRTHHVALTESISGTTVTARMYIDGAQVATTTYTDTSINTYIRMFMGGEPTFGQLFEGTMSHVAAYSTALSATRIAVHAQAGLSSITERTDQRISRIADWVGIPTADRNLDVGDGSVGWQSTSGQQPISAMQEVEETEGLGAALFMSGDNKLTFHNRSRRYNAAVFLTLDAQDAAQIGRELEFPGDDFGLVNDATVDRARGSQSRWVNQASINEYGMYRTSISTIAQTDTQALAIAQWLAENYGTPRTRTPNVTCDLYVLSTANPSLMTTILSTEISHKVRLSNLPAQAPVSTLDLFVEGSVETIGVAHWSIAFLCSPADFNTVWQLGVVGLSEVGISTRIAL